MPAAARNFSWSYSALDAYENCPRKYWASYVARLPETKMKTGAEQSGINEHKAFEDYLTRGVQLPMQLSNWKPVADKLLLAPGQRYVEHEMALDGNMQPCEWRDWDRAWLRAKLDVLVVNGSRAAYVDWKQGKFRPSNQQIKLSGLMVFMHYPAVETFNGLLAFVYQNRTHPYSITRADAPALWNEFLPIVRRMQTAWSTGDFPATPNPLCGWCPYKACPHNTSRS